MWGAGVLGVHDEEKGGREESSGGSNGSGNGASHFQLIYPLGAAPRVCRIHRAIRH